MKYTCPNCGKHMEFAVEQLTEAQYKVNCPQCGCALEIVGDYAYMPLEDGSLNLADDEPQEKEEEQPSRDPLYERAVELIKQCNAITPVMLASFLDIPMERAQQLMQQLEDNGIVGPYNGGAPRQILIPHNTNLPYGLPIFNQESEGNKEENPSENDNPEYQGDPKIKSYTVNCSVPGCLLFVLLVTLALILLFK